MMMARSFVFLWIAACLQTILGQSIVPGLDLACLQKAESGNCRARITQWYYNPASGFCDCFEYSGCEGNPNRFKSIEQCMNKCGVPRDQQIITTNCRNILKGTKELQDLLRNQNFVGIVGHSPPIQDSDVSIIDLREKPKIPIFNRPPGPITTAINAIRDNPPPFITNNRPLGQNFQGGAPQQSNFQSGAPQQQGGSRPVGTQQQNFQGVPQQSNNLQGTQQNFQGGAQQSNNFQGNQQSFQGGVPQQNNFQSGSSQQQGNFQGSRPVGTQQQNFQGVNQQQQSNFQGTIPQQNFQQQTNFQGSRPAVTQQQSFQTVPQQQTNFQGSRPAVTQQQSFQTVPQQQTNFQGSRPPVIQQQGFQGVPQQQNNFQENRPNSIQQQNSQVAPQRQQNTQSGEISPQNPSRPVQQSSFGLTQSNSSPVRGNPAPNPFFQPATHPWQRRED